MQDITPDAAGVDALHALLAELWQRFPDAERPAAEWQAAFTTAVGEIVSNVIRHSIRMGDPAARIHVTAEAAPGTVRLTMTNPGRPFVEPPAKPVPDAYDLDLIDIPEGSYGLSLARACLDALQYEGTATGDNTWTLIKHL